MARRDYCPTCGRGVDVDRETIIAVPTGGHAPPKPQHRCSEHSIRAREAANTRAEEPTPFADDQLRPLEERLARGFVMMEGTTGDD